MTTADRKRLRLVTPDLEPRTELQSARPALVPASAPDRRFAAPHRRSAAYERFAAALDGAGVALNGANPWDLRGRDERFFGQVLRHGPLGLGEAYVEGWWDCDRLDELVCRALRAGLHSRLSRPAFSGLWKAMLAGRRANAFESGERPYGTGHDHFARLRDHSPT